ncbi:hypothetical protein F4780DRAFT_736510 [Xylariomycetidae sp. FL0641]|nr:hypothetical protein F4780DRAFT_736510 [Xylariomycetidae sp. FL0641]
MGLYLVVAALLVWFRFRYLGLLVFISVGVRGLGTLGYRGRGLQARSCIYRPENEGNGILLMIGDWGFQSEEWVGTG